MINKQIQLSQRAPKGFPPKGSLGLPGVVFRGLGLSASVPAFARASEFLVVSHALVVVARIEIAKKNKKKNSRDAVSNVRKWCAPQSVS